jgi:hypothetical protein
MRLPGPKPLPVHIAVFVALLVFLPLLCFAKKEFAMPSPQAAKTYPAHDEHPLEKTTVALDPYDMPDKTKIFSVNYSEIGFLPVYLVITNDGDAPVSLAGMKAQFVTVGRTKISPASEDDVFRRLSKPSASTTSYPLPIPIHKVKGGVGKQAMEEIQNAMFRAKAVEPHSTQAGFLFFDVSDISTPLAGAHFYLTGVRDAKGNELMYFEVPLEKYLTAPAKP